MQTPPNGQAGKHNGWRAISTGPTCNIFNVNRNILSNMVYLCLELSWYVFCFRSSFAQNSYKDVSPFPRHRLRFLMEGAVNSAPELHEFSFKSFKRLERNGACCLPNRQWKVWLGAASTNWLLYKAFENQSHSLKISNLLMYTVVYHLWNIQIR